MAEKVLAILGFLSSYLRFADGLFQLPLLATVGGSVEILQSTAHFVIFECRELNAVLSGGPKLITSTIVNDFWKNCFLK